MRQLKIYYHLPWEDTRPIDCSKSIPPTKGDIIEFFDYSCQFQVLFLVHRFGDSAILDNIQEIHAYLVQLPIQETS